MDENVEMRNFFLLECFMYVIILPLQEMAGKILGYHFSSLYRFELYNYITPPSWLTINNPFKLKLGGNSVKSLHTLASASSVLPWNTTTEHSSKL